MAANINEIRNTVLAIANKNNYGYISPSDFNLYAKQAQMDMFEDYFYQYNNWINRQNGRTSGSGYADILKSLVEVIEGFSVTSFLAQTLANQYALPADYYFIDKLFYYPTVLSTGTNTFVNAFKLTDGAATFSNLTAPYTPPVGSLIVNTTTVGECFVTNVDSPTVLSISGDIMNLNDSYVIYENTNITEVERVSQNKIFYLTSSPLTAPSAQFPAYTLEGNTVTVYPTVIGPNVGSSVFSQWAASRVQAQYIRYPLTPQWTFVALAGGEPVFNNTAATFQDFELPDSDEPALIAKICQYVGIEIREGDVYQFGTAELNEETQTTT
tara:strand:+ start:2240 stop:3217 length:978 start_codon:yes stop_codon:yes gene_type:complete